MTTESIAVGMVSESTQEVTPERTAVHLGSGALRVFATPAMALLIEETCRKMVEPHLPPGKSTVGVYLELRHLAPTPVGRTVRAWTEIEAVEENVITFRAQVWDEIEQVGEARHRRAIIDIDRFQRRVEAKARGEQA
jgi:predicted thioesterase